MEEADYDSARSNQDHLDINIDGELNSLREEAIANAMQAETIADAIKSQLEEIQFLLNEET